MKILVSIVNWNATAATNECLSGIAKIAASEQPDIIVSDNNSLRDRLAIDKVVQSSLHSLKITNNKSNLGFAGGHNPNIKAAKEQGYDYVVLLNNDTEIIDKEIFTKLVKALETDENALGANPTILSSQDPNIIWYGGGRMSLKTGSASHLQVGEVEKTASKPIATEFLTGGCLAIALKRAELSQLLLSKDYFLYWEDSDWSARASRAGFKLFYVPEANVLHKVSSALGVRSPTYIYYNIRNHFIFIRRNINWYYRPLAWCGVFVIVAKYKLNILFRYKSGRWAAYKAIWGGLWDGMTGKTGQTRQIT